MAMISLPDNIFTRRPAARWALASAACLAGGVGALTACSAAPVKMECREIQMRIDYGDLTTDQLRFAIQELEECRGRAKAAEAKDSALIEGTEERFTPADQ